MSVTNTYTVMAAISGNRKSATFIDMTPMVDLAFLLLTFFVLTTNLNKSWTLRIDMPSNEKEPVNRPLLDHKRVLNLVLGDENKIYWYIGVPGNKAEITDFSAKGIRKVITEKRIAIKSLYILIKPSDKSQYKNIIDALDEMIITNHKDYSIVDLEAEDVDLIRNN